jgi:hypothetical protein
MLRRKISSKAVNGSQFLMAKKSEKIDLCFEGMGFDSFGMAIHFDIWKMTVILEKGEVSLCCNFGGVFCSGAAL